MRSKAWATVPSIAGWRATIGHCFPAPRAHPALSSLQAHQDWTRTFLAAPTVLGVIDTYGIELIHPMREGRSPNKSAGKASQIIAGLSRQTLAFY